MYLQVWDQWRFSPFSLPRGCRASMSQSALKVFYKEFQTPFRVRGDHLSRSAEMSERLLRDHQRETEVREPVKCCHRRQCVQISIYDSFSCWQSIILGKWPYIEVTCVISARHKIPTSNANEIWHKWRKIIERSAFACFMNTTDL